MEWASTTRLRLIVLLAAGCFQLQADLVLAEEDELPCPDDCIAGFELLWTGVESHEVVQTGIRDISNELVRRGPEYLSGLQVHESRYVYVAFKLHCDHKEERLAALLEASFAFLQSGVEFVMMDGPFVRGRDTIRFRGDHWSESACCQTD